nr:zinc finger, CCHC-type [Tanacetum cinerariifolium]
MVMAILAFYELRRIEGFYSIWATRFLTTEVLGVEVFGRKGAAGYRQLKVLEFFECPGPRQGVEDLIELLRKNGLVEETNVTLLAKVLRGFEFEVEPPGDHTFEVEPQKNIDQGVGLQKVQTQDLMDYQLARDREQHLACELFGYREDSNKAAFAVAVVEKIYAHESLTLNNIVACEAEIWATKGLLDKAKGNVLGMKIIKDQSGYTLRVSQYRFYNRKLVQTLLDGHSILSLEASLLGDCDVEKNGKWSCIYAVGSQEYQMVCTILDIESADVDLEEEIWLKGLLTESRYELRLVADIATGALVKGASRSEVVAQVEVDAYRY